MRLLARKKLPAADWASISLGSSQSQSTRHNEVDYAGGSNLLAGGTLSLVATGADKDSNLNVRGSTLTGRDV